MTHPLQPFLHDELVVLRAPTQVWSAPDGTIGTAPIHGIAHSDVRVVRGLRVRVGGLAPEHLVSSGRTADRVSIESLLRHLDDPTPDPGVRVRIDREVVVEGCAETLTLTTRHDAAIATTVEIELDLDATPIDALKQGLPPTPTVAVQLDDGTARWSGEHVTASLATTGLRLTERPGGLLLSADVVVPPRGSVSVGWQLHATDAIGAVRGATGPAPWSTPTEAGFAFDRVDPRLARWVDRALTDLDALRLTVVGHPDQQFLAAGAPWFFTLFGRDSLWAARLALPLDGDIAASTLRVLARLQGTVDDPETAQEPGKILHELRSSALEIPGEGISLPPRYYGSVDSTPLWICLLADAHRAGLPADEARALLPALRAALGWIRESGDSDGDGFLDYIDRLGTGLANQGWKDSGDSIQWRDGTLADGPIALCEVQGYAYEAALAGADLLDAFGDDRDAADATFWREWAADLKARFADAYWIETPEGRYPAVALDREKRPVDTLTSNIGHLLGTGILDAADEAHVAALLRGESMSSGYGIRTMSTGAAGYWPLSYHGGSVWVHDTAIAVHGMLRAGLTEDARAVVAELLDAAEGFAYRVPELHSGDPRAASSVPTPYPAACRPQAWSAAAAVVCLTAQS